MAELKRLIIFCSIFLAIIVGCIQHSQPVNAGKGNGWGRGGIVNTNTTTPAPTPTPTPQLIWYGVLTTLVYTPGKYTGNTYEINTNPGSNIYGTLDSSCGNVPVGWNNANITINNGPLAIGDTVAFYNGAGSSPFGTDCYGLVYNLTGPITVVSTPTPIPSATATAHVLVGDFPFAAHNYGGDNVDITTQATPVAQYINWAGGAPDTTVATTMIPLGVKVYQYMDWSLVNDGNYSGFDWNLATGTDSASQAIACSGGFVYKVTGTPGQQFVLTDPNQSATLSLADSMLANEGSASYTAFFSDDTFPAWLFSGKYPCGQNATTIGAAWAKTLSQIVFNGSNPSIIFNGLTVDTGTSAWNTKIQIENEPNVLGGMGESWYTGKDGSNNDIFITNDSLGCDPNTDNSCQWSQNEDIEIESINNQKLTWVYNRYASNNLTARLYSYASFMLTYDLRYGIYMSKYAATDTTLKVAPETGIVALNPLVTEPTNAQGIEQLRKGNLYFREYQNCYYRGSSIGTCAFGVNPTSVSESISGLTNSYFHQATLGTEMVLESGTVTFTASAPTSIPADSAVILVQ